MGLAGAKRKRVITEDPRNERWSRDSDRFGFKLLTSMGWTPESTSLNPTTAAPPPRKTLTSIPSAKDDMLGLGATGKTSASSVFSAFGSKGLRFVTAGAGEAERRRKTEGSDFASLLDRLNASTSTPPALEEDEADVLERERHQDASNEVTLQVAQNTRPKAAGLSRNSSRARHLAAKRLATSNPADLAAIMGYELPKTVPAAAPVVSSDAALPRSTPETDSEKAARKAERKRLKALADASTALQAKERGGGVMTVAEPTDVDSQAAKAARKAARKAKRKAERSRES